MAWRSMLGLRFGSVDRAILILAETLCIWNEIWKEV
jgi:hypothetical protein